VAGATGEGEQIADVRDGQYFSSFPGHYLARSLEIQIYGSDAARTTKHSNFTI
jgi:hypothetical protein